MLSAKIAQVGAPPLPCAYTAFAAETPPLPCASTAVAAKRLLLPCGHQRFGL